MTLNLHDWAEDASMKYVPVDLIEKSSKVQGFFNLPLYKWIKRYPEPTVRLRT